MKRSLVWFVLLFLAMQHLQAQEYPNLRSAWRNVVGKQGVLSRVDGYVVFQVDPEAAAEVRVKVVSVGSDNVVFLEERKEGAIVTIVPLNLILLSFRKR